MAVAMNNSRTEKMLYDFKDLKVDVWRIVLFYKILCKHSHLVIKCQF